MPDAASRGVEAGQNVHRLGTKQKRPRPKMDAAVLQIIFVFFC
jgi:hypothetical protein